MKNKKTNKPNSSSIIDGRKKPALVVTNEIVFFTKEQYELCLGEIYSFLKNYPFATILGHIATFVFSYGVTQLLNWVNEQKNEVFSFVLFLCENKTNFIFIISGCLLWIGCFILWKNRRGLKAFKKEFLNTNNNQRFKSQIAYDISGEIIPQG